MARYISSQVMFQQLFLLINFSFNQKTISSFRYLKSKTAKGKIPYKY